MIDIIEKHNINGPMNTLFTRSERFNKKNNNDYNMSGSIPRVKVVSDSTRPTIPIKNPISIRGIEVVKDSDSDDNSSVSSCSTIQPNVSTKPLKNKIDKPSKGGSKFDADDYQNFINNSKTRGPPSKKSENSDDYSDVSGSEDSDESDDCSDSSSDKPHKNSKKEKQEILLKLLALEKKGVELTKKYSMSSKLSDLKFEFELHKNNAEIEISIKFQQKCLMAAVTGLEFANKHFDPLGAKLDGWSESVMDNLDDYESIFTKLHEKYKSRADLPVELQLLVTLVASGFMFHVTKTLFSSAMPKADNNFQNSEIMKTIAAAMSQGKQQPNEISGPSMNFSSMLKDNDSVSSGSVETSKEVTISKNGKRAINL